MQFSLRKNRTIAEILALLLIIVVWWILSFNFPVRVLPSPQVVLDFIVQDFAEGEAVFHISQTLIRILLGFFVSLGIGVALGILMGTKPFWGKFFGTWVMVGLSFPDIMWPIIAIIWFGLGEIVALLAITMVVFPSVAVHIYEGTKATDKSLVDMARVFRIRNLSIIRRVYIPMLMPHIMSSMRYAIAVSWKIVILAELFGLSNGVGFMLNFWYRKFQVGQILAWVIMFIVIMVILDKFVLNTIEKRAFKWRPEVKL